MNGVTQNGQKVQNKVEINEKLNIFNLKATSPNPKSVPAPPPVNVPPPPCAPYCPKPGQVSLEIGKTSNSMLTLIYGMWILLIL